MFISCSSLLSHVACYPATCSGPMVAAMLELEAEFGPHGVPDEAIGAKCGPILDSWFFAKTPHILAMTLGHDVERRMQPFIAATVPGAEGVFKVGCLGTCYMPRCPCATHSSPPPAFVPTCLLGSFQP